MATEEIRPSAGRPRRSTSTRQRRPKKNRQKRSQTRVETTDANRLKIATIDWMDKPFQFKFPESRELKGMSEAELNSLLQRFDIGKKWPAMTADMQFYASRLSYISDRNNFYSTIDDMASSKKYLLGEVRTAYREFSTIDALDGNTETELIWIPDGDENTCITCAARGGSIGTIAYHFSRGLPGPSVCLGRENCRCMLAAV